ncbi:ion channel [Nitzschia inconspicua]|uniref:Ion channel n=1 Tax=Nitzschia inconspicua TaxID=303405 RepID=A0A9K3KHM1_9STRA|nr:ion channel [Nitzschia inconspicua]
MANRKDTVVHSTSIFRREASTDPVGTTNNITDSSNIHRQNSKDSSDGGTAFFVVDMDLTSQGDILCEEVSHLSDPTSYMLTTPIHTLPPPPRRRKSQRNFSGGSSGKRRLSASNLLKKPLSAIIRNHYFGNKKQTQPRLEHQPSSSSKRRKNNGGGNVSPIVEETSKNSPQISHERIPLTLLVPLGNEVGGGNYHYHSIQRHQDDSAENRDPTDSSHNNKWKSHVKQRDNPDVLHNAGLDLYRNPSLSWEDDNLLLFDDNQTATPRTPLGLTGGLTLSNWRTTGENQNVTTGFDRTTGEKTDSRLSWSSTQLFCRGRIDDRSGHLLKSLFQRWEYIAFGVSSLLLVIAMICGGSSMSSDDTSTVDLLYWAVTSFTTIGPLPISHASNEGGGGSSSPSTLIMILTMLYALLGVTTLGVIWGRHSSSFLTKTIEQQKQKHTEIQRQTLDVFCGPSHRGRNSPVRFSGCPSSTAFQLPSVTVATSCLVGITMLAVIVLLGQKSEWSVFETLYRVVATACTLGDLEMQSQPPTTKILILVLIPLALFATLRWVSAIACWAINSTASNMIAVDKMTDRDFETLLERAKLDDGLLTRADFLEIMLLSMKKVDPDLLMALREGFQKVTQGGSVDVTRSQLVQVGHTNTR